MSYIGMGNSLGSYYEFQPHQIFSGFGAIDFSAGDTWSKWVACNAAWQASKTVVPGCREAADAIRSALGQTGYGQLPLGTPWSTSDQDAWKAFAAAHNLPASGGMPTQTGLVILQELIAAKQTPGGKDIYETHKVGTQYIPGPAPGQKAMTAGMGMGSLAMLGLLGVALVGGAAVLAKRAKTSKGGRGITQY